MTPTEKHRETAKDIAFDFDCDWTADGRRRGEAEYHAAIEAIAAALAKAEREGMKRTAEIARGSSGEFDFQSALAEGRDFDYGFHNGKNHAADSILAAIILSEAGED